MMPSLSGVGQRAAVVLDRAGLRSGQLSRHDRTGHPCRDRYRAALVLLRTRLKRTLVFLVEETIPVGVDLRQPWLSAGPQTVGTPSLAPITPSRSGSRSTTGGGGLTGSASSGRRA